MHGRGVLAVANFNALGFQSCLNMLLGLAYVAFLLWSVSLLLGFISSLHAIGNVRPTGKQEYM